VELDFDESDDPYGLRKNVTVDVTTPDVADTGTGNDTDK
jgi:hypothetical protein